MTTLTWLFFGLSFASGGVISNRVTRWYYKRRVKKLTALLDAANKRG